VTTTYQVLRFCEEYVEEWGFPPTVREIQIGCRLASTSDVACHLARLRAMGAIDSIPGAARTIRLLGRTP
jgi:repressor LexA